MKRAGKILLSLGVLLTVLVVIPVAYSTVQGYAAWYFAVPRAKVRINGKPVSSWVHRDPSGQEVLVTFDNEDQRATYAVLYPYRNVRPRCPVAPALPLFFEGDLMPPGCFDLACQAPLRSEPIDRKLRIDVNSVSFVDDAGRCVEVTW